MDEKKKPFKTVNTEYFEELDSKFPGRNGQPGTAGRRIRVVTTTVERVGSIKDPVTSTTFAYL